MLERLGGNFDSLCFVHQQPGCIGQQLWGRKALATNDRDTLSAPPLSPSWCDPMTLEHSKSMTYMEENYKTNGTQSQLFIWQLDKPFIDTQILK